MVAGTTLSIGNPCQYICGHRVQEIPICSIVQNGKFCASELLVMALNKVDLPTFVANGPIESPITSPIIKIKILPIILNGKSQIYSV